VCHQPTTVVCRLSTYLTAIILLCASQVGAQVIQRPERPITGIFGGGRPPDPARSRQDLKLTLSTLGGYDENLTPGQSGGGEFITREPGYSGLVDAALEYRRGRQTQMFEIGGRAFMNTFRNVGLTPAYGGDLRARLVAPLGRRVRLELSENVRNEPFYTLGAFTPLRGDVGPEGLPDTNAASGFTLRPSWANDSALSLIGTWAGGSTLAGGYSYAKQDFRDDVGDSASHRGSLDYTAAIGRRSSIRSSYQHSEAEFVELDTVRPITHDTIDVGYQHERQASRTRRWSLGFGAGAIRVDTLNRDRDALTYTTPSGYARTRLDLGRTWSVSADYRRSVSALEGLTAELFVTDTGLVRLGGFIGQRAEIVVSTAYSEGAQSFATSTGTFDSYTGTVQLRYMLTRIWSVVAVHNFYRHAIHDVPNLPAGFPTRLDRNAFQVGMTLGLPLYGAYTRQRPQQPAGRD
jgi:hypothetical protein